MREVYSICPQGEGGGLKKAEIDFQKKPRRIKKIKSVSNFLLFRSNLLHD